MTIADTNRIRDERWARTTKLIARDCFVTAKALYEDARGVCFHSREAASDYLGRRAEQGLLEKAKNRHGFEIRGRYVLPAGREAQ